MGQILIINSESISTQAKAQNLNRTRVDCAFFSFLQRISFEPLERTWVKRKRCTYSLFRKKNKYLDK